MSRLRLTCVAIAFAALSILAGPASAEELLVFAAASTKNAAEDIGRLYAEESDNTVTFLFASSSDLAEQIENGAPAALFISADTRWIDSTETTNWNRFLRLESLICRQRAPVATVAA